MGQEIYNEGRVVGLSAWEIFAKNAEANGVDPADIPGEAQWLTSMIGAGASMILRVPAGTVAGVNDFRLPQGSNLTAAGVIIANPFMGQCEWSGSTWATKVISYGPLVLNDDTDYPTSADVPADDTYNKQDYDYIRNCVSEFAQITDGVVFTNNATWVPSHDGEPEKDIDPNFNESSTVVRLYVSATLKYDVYILLTGFQNKRILQGLSKFATEDGGISAGGSTDTDENDWVNGGLVGPEVIPWASKIVFSVPSAAYNLLNSLSRTIPSDTTYTAGTKYGFEFKNITGEVKSNSFVDFNSINLTDYYTVRQGEFQSTPTLQENVNKVITGVGDAYNTLTAWYPGMSASAIKSATSEDQFFPPALYAAQVSTVGTQTLVPLDVAAPGTVKGFEDEDQARAYKTLLPDNYALYHNKNNDTFSFVSLTGTWSGTAKIAYDTNAPKATITAGNKQVGVVALTQSDAAATPYNTSGSAGVLNPADPNNKMKPNRYFTWDNALNSLSSGQKFDVLGDRLEKVGNELATNNTMGSTYQVKSLTFTNSGGGQRVGTITSAAGATGDTVVAADCGIKSGTNYVEFSNGLRLYISKSAPTGNIPTGSIGIGW